MRGNPLLAAVGAVPSPGPHGGDGARIAAALGVDPRDVLDLSASINPLAPDVARLAARRLDSLSRYPEPSRATAALAEAVGVDVRRLLVTNGGSEAISLVAAAVGGHVVEPEFALHPRGPVGTGPRWRSNPGNPGGRLAGPDEVAGVWDESFFPLATGRWTRGDAGAVVVGSLTKVFACPGLRLGYVLGDEAFVGLLAARQPCWSVNTLALALVPDLLEAADLAGWARRIADLRAELVRLLDAHGLAPLPSDANFVLCARGTGLRSRLAPHGVVVRDCSSFGLEGHVRIAVPDGDGLERLASALEASAP